MRLTITLSAEAQQVIDTLRLPAESTPACVNRLLSNLLPISYDAENYEAHFGPQRRAARLPRGQHDRSPAPRRSKDEGDKYA